MKDVLGVILIFLLTLFAVQFARSNELIVESTVYASPKVLAAETEKSDNPLLVAINTERSRLGINPLKLSDSITEIADARVDDMIFNKYFSHTSPSGAVFSDTEQLSSVDSCENLNLTINASPQYIVQSWLDSPSHRDCLLDSHLKHAGLAQSILEYNVVQSNGDITSTYLTVLIAAN